jgi:hypothetical protein
VPAAQRPVERDGDGHAEWHGHHDQSGQPDDVVGQRPPEGGRDGDQLDVVIEADKSKLSNPPTPSQSVKESSTDATVGSQMNTPTSASGTPIRTAAVS